jgi:hypothetical protein
MKETLNLLLGSDREKITLIFCSGRMTLFMSTGSQNIPISPIPKISPKWAA